jgi:hypothetical protein
MKIKKLKLFPAKLLRRRSEPVVFSLNLTLSPDWKPEPQEEDPDPPAIISNELRDVQLELVDLDRRFAEVYEALRLQSDRKRELEQQRLKKWWIRALNPLKRFVVRRFSRFLVNRYSTFESLINARIDALASLVPVQHELHERLDRVCYFYLIADGPSRRLLRDSIIGRHNILWALVNHPVWCAQQIKLPSDRVFLKTGLASASLENQGFDYRDTGISLISLYRASVKAGIEPSADFAAVGLLSSAKPIPRSTKEMLMNFEKSWLPKK